MGAQKNITGFPFLIVSLGAVFALPVFASNYKGAVIALFALATVIVVAQRKWFFNKNFFMVNAVVYILALATLFYTENWGYAHLKLETMVSLVLFPFLFSMFREEELVRIKQKVRALLWVYIVAVFLLNVVPFFYFYLSNPNYGFAGILQHFPTIMVVDTGRYEIHPIYLSMHCSVAGLFSLYVFKGIEKNWAKVLLGLVNVVLLLFLLLYAKKGPLLALMLVSFLFIGFQRKSKWVKPYIFGLIALAVLLVAIPKTRNNFFELFSIETIEGGNITSTNIRYTIYNTAIAKIAEKPFTGYGIGDHNQALYDGYREAGNTYLLENELNAHNQYLSLLLIGGLFLLLALFFTLGMNLVYAVRYNNQILILLIIFYSVVMFTENILEREDGVIYFALFLNFFARLSYEQPKKDGAAGHQKTPIEPYPA